MPADYAEIIDLANLAYRGREGAVPSWNIEKGIVGGQRLDASLLNEELAAKPDGALLVYRDSDGPLLGTAWLNPETDGVWSMGLLTIRPELQNQQLGRRLLAAVEQYAHERGARRMRIGVLHVRDTLIAWYERRGYRATGETEPYPTDDPRFGTPLQDNLHFLIMEKQI